MGFFVLNVVSFLYFLETTVTGLTVRDISIYSPAIEQPGVVGNEFQVGLYITCIILTLAMGMFYLYSKSRLIATGKYSPECSIKKKRKRKKR
jgi:hypothetical protein